jgi:hypothetical protein
MQFDRALLLLSIGRVLLLSSGIALSKKKVLELPFVQALPFLWLWSVPYMVDPKFYLVRIHVQSKDMHAFFLLYLM